jgi:RimJ/RimL family protein N-acetyltransferase
MADQGATIADPGPASRSGRSVRLVPVNREHLDFLYSLATEESIGYRWVLYGQAPSREAFEQRLWSGVLSQFVVFSTGNGSPMGTTLAYNGDLNSRYAYVGMAVIPEAVGTGVGIEAMDLFVGYLFKTFNLRKLYYELPAYNLPEIRTLVGTVFREEGVLKGHTYYAGDYWDRHIFALYREDYEALPSGRFLGRSRRTVSGE